jgi:hypothetical protein
MTREELRMLMLNKTVAELIDGSVSLHEECRLISRTADLLVRVLASTDAASPNLLQLAQTVLDTANHCCRVIEGPR